MIRYLLPLGVAVVITAFLGWGLTMNPHKVASALLGEPVPAFSVPTLANPEAVFTQARFTRHEVSLLNVWASWCKACRVESDLLMRVARRTDVPIYGLNYKDTRAAARTWLARFGNPYTAIAFDPKGKVGFDLGVYGVPETYIVDSNGIIRYKHIGPISSKDWRETLWPIIQRVQGKSG